MTRKWVNLLLVPLVLLAQSTWPAHAHPGTCAGQDGARDRHVHLDTLFGEVAHRFSGESPEGDPPGAARPGEPHDQHAVYLPAAESLRAERATSSAAHDGSQSALLPAALGTLPEVCVSLRSPPDAPGRTTPVHFLTLRLLI